MTKLTHRQQQLLEALETAPSVAAAARSIGMADSNAHRMIKTDRPAKALALRRKERLENAKGVVQEASGALKRLVRLFNAKAEQLDDTADPVLLAGFVKAAAELTDKLQALKDRGVIDAQSHSAEAREASRYRRIYYRLGRWSVFREQRLPPQPCNKEEEEPMQP